jgi:hypothetical protein
MSTLVAVLLLAWGVLASSPLALVFGALWFAFALTCAYRLTNRGVPPAHTRTSAAVSTTSSQSRP